MDKLVDKLRAGNEVNNLLKYLLSLINQGCSVPIDIVANVFDLYKCLT